MKTRTLAVILLSLLLVVGGAIIYLNPFGKVRPFELADYQEEIEFYNKYYSEEDYLDPFGPIDSLRKQERQWE